MNRRTAISSGSSGSSGSSRADEVPTLLSVMRSAVTQVTGERTPGQSSASRGGFGQQGRWAMVSTANWDRSVSVNHARVAQLSGGGGTNVTSPNFYTPFTTPSSYQIPNNRKEEYMWARFFAKNEPLVAAAISFYTDFPVSGYDLVSENSVVKEWFNSLCASLRVKQLFPQISHAYHLYGDCFIIASIDCEH